MTQELKPTDPAQCRGFVESIIEQQKVDSDFSNKIIFSAWTNFHRDGYVNQIHP